MIVTHVITSISRQSGGTSSYIKSLLDSLSNKSENNLVCFESDDAVPIDFDVSTHFISLKSQKINGFSKEFYVVFDTIKTQIFHGNGLWMFPTHLMAKYARKNNIPYIISPHGMLDSWSLEQKRLKKLVALKLFQRYDLNNASCIHVTSQREADNVRALGFKNPIALIPNGINIQEFSINNEKLNAHVKKLLFLSRIYQGKGLEDLIEGWSELDLSTKKNWQVEIIGNGDVDYIESLKNLINKLDLTGEITISQPVYGKEKIKCYQSADLFVLPTYSENFGIVVAEALASGTPVITTKGAPWKDLLKFNCGDWIEIGKEPLKNCLNNFLTKPLHELQSMGLNGRYLIEKKYSMEAISNDMLSLYRWILNKDEQPEFVTLSK